MHDNPLDIVDLGRRGALLAIVAVASLTLACDGPEARAQSGGGQNSEETTRTESTGSDPKRDDSDDSSKSDPARTDSSSDTPDRSLVERAMDPSVALPDRAAEAFDAIDYDPIPKNLTENSHYVVSNERYHHVYRPHIRDHGGILMGVGTDQNYLMAGWSESPILLMMDFDEQIRNVHHLYGIVFDRVDEPKHFIHQWSDEEVDEIRKWIEKARAGDEERIEELKETLELANDHIFYRLRKTAERYREAEIPTFVTSDEQYDFIRGLWERGRVIPIRGDLTGDVAMQEIAHALDQVNLEVGLLYLSNAEQYFEYTPAYRRNIAVIPYEKDGLVLRTRPMEALGVPKGGKYHYNIQDAREFADWMVDTHVDDGKQMISWYMESSDEQKGLSFIRQEAHVSDAQPTIAEIGDEYDLEIDQEKPADEEAK